MSRQYDLYKAHLEAGALDLFYRYHKPGTTKPLPDEVF